MLTLKAYAKVNLTLEVLGKREDGYHQVVTVMQTIDLCDKLRFATADDLSLSCNVADLEGRDNLAMKAAVLLKEYAGYSKGATIHLEKTIPVASGLGGGSSDAATTLKALNQLWGLGLQHEALRQLAVSLGSDVPFFLEGGTAMAQGRGEDVHRLPPMPPVNLVILCPPLNIPNKTGTLYGKLTPQNYTDGGASHRLGRSLMAGKRPSAKALFNAFEAVTFEMFPLTEEYRQAFLEAGAPWVRLTGAGPAMYTFTVSRRRALLLARNLRNAGYHPCVACTIDPLGAYRALSKYLNSPPL